MAQFDVYENVNKESKRSVPFLLDIQADLLDSLSTSVVVPLVAASVMGKAAAHLHPIFKVKRVSVVMSTAELAGVPISTVGPKVGSLATKRGEIIAALDFLISGF